MKEFSLMKTKNLGWTSADRKTLQGMSTVAEPVVYVDEWRGLYSESWKGVIVDEAFAHPAKFSRALIRKIYDHVVAEGWIKSGDRVIDPFGGVALGGLDAMRHGLCWHGHELEEKFVALGNQNIALWNDRFSRMPNWGVARLIQGDSRRLTAVWAGAALSIASPPYANDTVNERNGINLSLIKKPGGHNSQSRTMSGYGEASGQLGAMKEGDHSIAITSPPWEKGAEGVLRKEKFRDPLAFASEMASRSRTNGGHGASASAYMAQLERDAGKVYGDTAGQLGQQSGETFWSASRMILEQLHQVLAPNAHAVFVVKAFVRDKKIVDFPAQWAQLCEAVGFKLLHDHHALLTEHYGTQGGFDGDKTLRVERKSFFRRLAESKGSPRIDYENVLCFRKV